MASFKKIGTENWQVSFYCKDYLGVNKKYKKSGFKTKKEASDYAIEFINASTGSSNILFHNVLDEYMDFCKDKVKFQTFISRKTLINKIKENTPNIPLKDIDQKILFNFFENIKDTPAIRKSCKSLLSLIFDYGKVNYGLKINPCRDFRLPKLKNEDLETETEKIWTLEEFKAFEKFLDTKLYKSIRLKYRAFFSLLYYSGARVGEIIALNKSDIDFKKSTISINKTRLRNEKFNSPKTKSSIRKVTIPNNTLDILKEYCDSIPDIKDLPIFNNYHSIKSNFRKWIKKNEHLPKITLHCLRHSHVSFLIKKGIDIVSISKRIGHSNPGITLSVYSHFYKEEKDEILNLLNEIKD